MDSETLRLLRLLDEGQTLSAVARRMNVAVSTVARRIDGLEVELHTRLLDRRASGVRLTTEGRRIAALAGPLIDQADAIRREADLLNAGDGERALTISATEFVVSDVLAPALPALIRRAPTLPVILRAQAELVSLAERQADLAIRMSTAQGDSLIQQPLGEIALGCFAHPAYLAGRSATGLNLGRERLLIYDDTYGRMQELDWIAKAGLGQAVALRTGSTRALLMAAQAGAGIAILPRLFALRAGLVEIATPFSIPSRTVVLLIHRDIRRLPMVKIAHRWVVETFAAMHKAGI